MRIKIVLPEVQHHYSTSLRVRVSDLNYGNHLGNDSLLALAHECRMKYFASCEQTELNYFGNGLIMIDSAIQYLAQGHWGDELMVNLWHQPTGAARFDLFYELLNTQSKRVALIKTGMAFFDYTKQRLASPTEQYLIHIEGLNDLS